MPTLGGLDAFGIFWAQLHILTGRLLSTARSRATNLNKSEPSPEYSLAHSPPSNSFARLLLPYRCALFTSKNLVLRELPGSMRPSWPLHKADWHLLSRVHHVHLLCFSLKRAKIWAWLQQLRAVDAEDLEKRILHNYQAA